MPRCNRGLGPEMIAQQRAVGQFGPWFRTRPRLALTVACFLGVGAWSLGYALPGDRAALAVVFGLPIALVAVTFGCKGGVVAGVSAMALIVVWDVQAGTQRVGLSVWASAAAMLMLGALLGAAVDGLAASERQARHIEDMRRHVEQAADRHREAAAINDALVQNAAVAKWALEAGNDRRALEVLEETIDAGQRLVTALLNDAYEATSDGDFDQDLGRRRLHGSRTSSSRREAADN